MIFSLLFYIGFAILTLYFFSPLIYKGVHKDMFQFIKDMIRKPTVEDKGLLGRIEALGITKDQFAKYIGVTTSCVNRWINGTHKLNPIANRVLVNLEDYPSLILPILWGEI